MLLLCHALIIIAFLQKGNLRNFNWLLFQQPIQLRKLNLIENKTPFSCLDESGRNLIAYYERSPMTPYTYAVISVSFGSVLNHRARARDNPMAQRCHDSCNACKRRRQQK